MTIHLAIIDPLGMHGGMHYYDHDLANALVEQGHGIEVFVATTGLEGQAAYRMHPSFENVYGDGQGSRLKRARNLAIGLVRALFKAKGAGSSAILIHVFKSDVFEFLTVAMARVMGMRAYAIVHDVARLDAKTRLEFRGAIVRFASGLVVHNAFSRSALVAATPLADRKTAIVPHGNYVDRFPDMPSMMQAREVLGLPQSPLVLLFFGNPRREKGLSLLIEAMEPLKDNQRLLLVVAGKMKPADEAELRADIRARGLDARVRLDIGHVADEAMPLYFRASCAVILPYHRVYESGVALMAMSFGRTILASDLAVFRDLVTSGGGRHPVRRRKRRIADRMPARAARHGSRF
ncbi:glycosyltransferase family 4 protein [Novosphingobium sp. BL-52-GroH]|uniref:glycosyltransferase family 4 protein n=1 Tax=Novosphingobium sp. BL-52-GroH TaxID=3349877 RepID=UPI00384F006D